MALWVPQIPVHIQVVILSKACAIWLVMFMNGCKMLSVVKMMRLLIEVGHVQMFVLRMQMIFLGCITTIYLLVIVYYGVDFGMITTLVYERDIVTRLIRSGRSIMLEAVLPER